MNIHSDYRKLNDYKGASCGQHSALSTQHSALSTQHSVKSISRRKNKINAFKLLIIVGCLHVSSSVASVCGLNDNLEYATPEAACLAGAAQFTGGCTTTTFKTLLNLGPFSFSHIGQIKYGPSAYGIQYTCRSDVTSNCSGMTPYYEYDGLHAWCLGNSSKPTISLTPAPNQIDPRPKGTEGKDPKSSTYELIAKVIEGGAPKAGVAVGFGVGVEAQTGGHAHGDLGSIPRPKGKLSKTSGETDLNGEIKLTFIADEPAGLHPVVADCTPAGCANKATHVVKVKVPDLIHIPPDYGSSPARYVLIGNYKTPENPTQQINHNDTHFLTDQSWENLKGIIKTFTLLGWGQVGINDASLEWGGMFDIEGRWLDPVLRPSGKFTTGGHAEHRDGQQVDISFVRPASVSEALRKKVYDEACSAKEVELPRILWHKNDGYAPHFHIYLTGKGVTGAKKQCGVS